MERELPEGISPAPPPTGCQQLSEAFLLVTTAASRPGFLCQLWSYNQVLFVHLERESLPRGAGVCREKPPSGRERSEVDGERKADEKQGGGEQGDWRGWGSWLEEGAQCLGEGS